jgi:chemotaxis response regulator CheB
VNAVAEPRQATTVALLGPADAAREQLRHALINFGAELVFEGSLGEGGRLTGASAHPDVVLINLEPGVEDDLEAIQSMLEDPSVSVVFNEGEVSSQLTGWDLARWARHLAAKVLGVRDTLPPAPSGAERLPVLDLVPEPGRPVTPAQQQDHLNFDTFAGEVFEHLNEVPVSPRLELAAAPVPPTQAKPVEVAATPVEASREAAQNLAALDFDFSPVAPSTPDELVEELPEQIAQGDDLEDVDLTAVFESGLDQLTPEDLLARLQMAMGLDPVPLTNVSGERPPSVARAPEHPTSALEPAAAEARLASLAPTRVVEPAPPVTMSQGPVLAGAEGRADLALESVSDGLDFDWQLAEPAAETDEADLPPRTSSSTLAPESAATHSATTDFSLSFDPVAAESSDYSTDGDDDIGRRWSGSDSLELSELDLDADAADIDAGEAEPASAVSGFDFSAPAAEYDDYALGGTLGLESTADDETIARLAAELDANAPAEIKPELPGFDFSRPVDLSESEPAPAAAPAPLAAARTTEAAPKAAAPSASFGALSLEPLDAPGLHTAAPSKPVTPEKEFDFSHLTLSLEPLEEVAPTSAGSEVSTVGTMRDGTWLRDIGDHVPPPPEQAEPVEDSTAATNGYEATPPAQSTGFAVALPPTPAPALGHGVSRVVALCASIGGPDALRSFLSSLPAGFPAVFVVIQHLENGYFERLAQQLQKTSKLPVRVPMAGVDARDGEVLVVSSDRRFKLAIDGQIELSDLETQSRYRPCIDDVLRDLSDSFGANVTAIVFSGMAADAVEGAVYLTQRGGEVWAQDPESCVVSSMVDGTRARGVVEFVGSPRELAEHCVRRLGVTA